MKAGMLTTLEEDFKSLGLLRGGRKIEDYSHGTEGVPYGEGEFSGKADGKVKPMRERMKRRKQEANAAKKKSKSERIQLRKPRPAAGKPKSTVKESRNILEEFQDIRNRALGGKKAFVQRFLENSQRVANLLERKVRRKMKETIGGSPADTPNGYAWGDAEPYQMTPKEYEDVNAYLSDLSDVKRKVSEALHGMTKHVLTPKQAESVVKDVVERLGGMVKEFAMVQGSSMGYDSGIAGVRNGARVNDEAVDDDEVDDKVPADEDDEMPAAEDDDDEQATAEDDDMDVADEDDEMSSDDDDDTEAVHIGNPSQEDDEMAASDEDDDMPVADEDDMDMDAPAATSDDDDELEWGEDDEVPGDVTDAPAEDDDMEMGADDDDAVEDDDDMAADIAAAVSAEDDDDDSDGDWSDSADDDDDWDDDLEDEDDVPAPVAAKPQMSNVRQMSSMKQKREAIALKKRKQQEVLKRRAAGKAKQETIRRGAKKKKK